MENYLQLASGESFENISFRDVQKAIARIITMDEEHGAFWVSIPEEEETVLETYKDLTVTGIFPGPEELIIRARMQAWSDIEQLYDWFLKGDFDIVKGLLRKSEIH